ncbi:MAG: N-acetyltransferase [Herpetosiphonaceae bacterium]|nr:N-acetyltransferase [Herpetosiphonaceae bacterium]
MSEDFPNVVVKDNREQQRFETVVAGQLAVAEYKLADGRITFTHTEVPEALAGHGIANKLVKTALEHARTEQLAVIPLCPFVTSYIRRHPDYRPLVDQAYQSRVQ